MENEFTFENPEYRKTYWHTCSHIMAQAVKRLWPEVKLAIGPSIDEGWYYDLDAPFAFTPEHLEQIEAEMRKICKEKLKLERFELPRSEAIQFMEEKGEPYKVELIQDLPEDALLCPMIDARRMEVYAAVYDRALKVKRAIGADIIDENSYAEFLDKQPVYFFGNGAAKCREKITHPNAHFIEDIHPLAKWMFPLAEKAVAVEDYKDVAYFEPFYLKEFVASTPKKLL